HRIPQADRCRLSGPYRDQVDPRQSFGTHLQGDKGLACTAARRPLPIHLHAHARFLAQSSSKGSSPSSLVRCCATSASHPNRNSRIASWLPWITSIRIRSSTHGPTNSIEPPDMIRNLETMN